MCNESQDIVVQPLLEEEVFRALNLCVIPVRIQVGNNVRFYDFLVDTGANKTVITTSIVKELGISQGENVRVSEARQISQGWRRGKVDNLSIGEIFFPSLDIIINDLSRDFIRYRIDGVLGSDVLKTTHLKINYLIPLLEIAKRIVL